MSSPTRYVKGEWKAVCDVCGFRFDASHLRRRWDGLMVCDKDYEERQPQDFVRAKTDIQAVPWTRPESTAYSFILASFGSIQDITIDVGGDAYLGWSDILSNANPSLTTFGARQGVATNGSISIIPAWGLYCSSTTDGITFTLQNLGRDQYWYDVSYGNGLFIAVGQVTGFGSTTFCSTSPDGVNWTARSTMPNLAWLGIEYSPSAGRFIARGTNGGGTIATYSSVDGLSWSLMTGGTVTDVAGGGITLAASPTELLFVSKNSNKIDITTDGLTWTGHTGPATLQASSSLSYNGSHYVIVIGSGSTDYYLSVDGINWTGPYTLPFTGGTNDIFSSDLAGKNFVVPTSSQIVWMSTDLTSPTNWVQFTVGGTVPGGGAPSWRTLVYLSGSDVMSLVSSDCTYSTYSPNTIPAVPGTYDLTFSNSGLGSGASGTYTITTPTYTVTSATITAGGSDYPSTTTAQFLYGGVSGVTSTLTIG